MHPLLLLLIVASPQAPAPPVPPAPAPQANRSDYLPLNVRLPPVTLQSDEFVAASEAARAGVLDDDAVLGLTLGGRSRAYPVAIVATNEVVNDDLAGVAIAITW